MQQELWDILFIDLNMMNYDDTIEFLYTQVPMFQRIGANAYKPGLDTSRRLDDIFGNPHKNYKTIHVAGTNGKGSVSHTLASILQKSGYKVGLYTSPHLVDYRERIRVNGEKISKKYVIDFVERFKSCNFNGHPSFFELTMMMAFDYFSYENVDIAVIEVGLGGRLDSTNIIFPIACVITNISFDHMQFLGDTLPKIASEKAGIIKNGIPTVIGEADGEVKDVFENKAAEVGAPIIFAQDNMMIKSYERNGHYLDFDTYCYGKISYELSGDCQIHNANTVLNVIPILRSQGLRIPDKAISEGFHNVCEISGLMGRWMQIAESPRTICDTGHNIGGFKYISEQLKRECCGTLRIVIGFVNDKDVNHILDILPKTAKYYFTKASVPRAMECDKLANLAITKGLKGNAYDNVADAYSEAVKESATTDMIYVGGSTFVVADLLSLLQISR